MGKKLAGDNVNDFEALYTCLRMLKLDKVLPGTASKGPRISQVLNFSVNEQIYLFNTFYNFLRIF